MASKKQSRGFTLVELLVVIAIIGVLVGLLLPAVQAAREAARRMDCSNRIRQSALGMHNYESAYKRLPINYKQVGGWVWEATNANVAILPFMEQNALYSDFNQNANNWGWTYNIGMNTKVTTFICPSSQAAPKRGQHPHGWDGPGSNYAWCTGSNAETVWAGDRFNGMISYTDPRKFADVVDGLSNTIMGGEILSGSGKTDGNAKYPLDIFYVGDGLFNSIVNKEFPTQAELTAIGIKARTAPIGSKSNNGTMWAWYAAAQSSFNTATTPNWDYPSAGGDCCPGGAHDWGWGLIPPRSKHTGGVNVSMGDASTQFISKNIDLLTFQRMGHRDDGASSGEGISQ